VQIDFHHATTYVLARLAGFSHDEADVVAYSSQYVDDAVNAGAIEFENGASYSRISSAHKMLDYRNFEALADAVVWVPFHFLPGNGGLPAGQEPQGPFIRKLVCLPNSPIAQDMVRAAIWSARRPWGLHRLGISMHVYADTWAHQGFAGVSHAVNHARDIAGPTGAPDTPLLERLKSYFINDALPLGHGTVLGNPDKPYLVWAYTNGLGERIQRNNPRDFLEASDHICRAMQCFRAGDPNAVVPGLPPRDGETLARMFKEITVADDDERHRVWLEQIARGVFSFGPQALKYTGEGEGSWKHEALGTVGNGPFTYRPAFLRSHWKMFHDALQAHRFEVVHEILPAYGISTA
jgi:hypothetical protein